MSPGDPVAHVGQRGFALRSIQHRDASVRVLHQHGDVEVMAVEIGARASLVEPSLWMGSSWHLVVQGQVIFQQRNQMWELLPEECLFLKDAAPYTIGNPTPGRVKLITLVFRPTGS
jgi:hypothetical protein